MRILYSHYLADEDHPAVGMIRAIADELRSLGHEIVIHRSFGPAPQSAPGGGSSTTEPDGLRAAGKGKLWFAKARVAGGEDATGEVTITFEPDGSAEAALVQISSEDDTQTLLVYPWTAKSVLVAGAIDELPTDVVDEGRGGSASVRYR